MITVVVPTFRRPQFIVRALEYFSAAGFAGEVLVGDSSDGEAAERAKAAVARLRPRLRAQHVDCRGLDDRLSLHRLSTLVQTRYVAFIGDDDFLVPSAMEQCAEFLEHNPSFVAAHGQGWTFDVSPGDVHGRMRIFESYRQPELLHDSARQRLESLLADYSVGLFSVHRAEAWREMWRRVPEVRDRTFGAELLPCCLSAVLGKTKHLDCFYLLRQTTHASHYLLPQIGDWVTKEHWRPAFELFCEELSRAVELSDGTPGAFPASSIEKRFVALRLKPAFPAYSRAAAAPAALRSRSRLREAIKAIPGVHAGYLSVFRRYWHTRVALQQRDAIIDAVRFSLRMRLPWLKSLEPARKELLIVRQVVGKVSTEALG